MDNRDRFADADKLVFILKVGEKAAQVFEKWLVAAQQKRDLQNLSL
jgi:hypothetical protein